MVMRKRKRGRPGFGGIRIILHLAPQQIKALENEQKRVGNSRAELIRRAIDALYLKRRRANDWEDRQ